MLFGKKYQYERSVISFLKKTINFECQTYFMKLLTLKIKFFICHGFVRGKRSSVRIIPLFISVKRKVEPCAFG